MEWIGTLVRGDVNHVGVVIIIYQTMNLLTHIIGLEQNIALIVVEECCLVIYKESNKMLLDIIGFVLCALGGGIVGRVVAQRNNSTKGLALSCLAVICLIIGTMAVVL